MPSAFETHKRHAVWAMETAADYRRMASEPCLPYWEKKWLDSALKLEAEADWFERSAGWMKQA